MIHFFLLKFVFFQEVRKLNATKAKVQVLRWGAVAPLVPLWAEVPLGPLDPLGAAEGHQVIRFVLFPS